MQVLTDAQWAKLEAAIAAIKQGRPANDRNDHLGWTTVPNGGRSPPNWVTGTMPTCFRRWAVSCVWDKIMAHVVAEGEPKLAFACIDGTVARAH
jgi:hypothetical protein